MGLRLEWLPVAVIPGVLRDVSVVDEDGLRVPVQSLTLQPIATFENQDAFAGGRQGASQGAATGSAPDNDDVVIRWHRCAPVYSPGLLCMRPPSAKTVVAVT